ncbi:M16 family metallopeptidase [Entomohabitans teleogrylli]|uniref:M16 family metallopeptidase n=1 Tax=Entomohabitans teleogrylli TaxID=1384589 RepID=UPI00073D5B31|nr:pitrilysin family protein [Entomohabitans teleogrylli]
MQGKTIRLFAGGLLMGIVVSNVQAEALQPDPAWQQGTLPNGFQWQVLATPQRPSDRIEIRLTVNSGSLTESAQQSGYSRFIPHLALMQTNLSAAQTSAFWQQGSDPQRAYPPAIVSYDFTQFSLSLPNNRADLLKEAFGWLANSAGKLSITQETVAQGLQAQNDVPTWPTDPRDGWWRYRLKGSTLLGHDPLLALKQPVDAQQLAAFYHKWYTPDAMTLIVVGNVDSRAVSEQINKAFGELKGKRETPAPVPTIAPLKREAVSIMTDKVRQDRLLIMWDNPWQPIRESAALLRYWRADLAREALFWRIQQSLSKNNAKDIGLGFDCRVLFLRAQCGINLDSPNDKLAGNYTMVARELANVRENGLSGDEFNALVAQKNLELQKLFATYARSDTDILINQRLRSLQNQVVDIAPERYQRLRQDFLSGLTVESLNQELRQLLSQDMALVLLQPQGEPEYSIKALREDWDKVMTPVAAPVAVEDSVRQDVSDIPPAR